MALFLNRLRPLVSIIKGAGGAFLDDRAPRIGAALAFYTALSLSPLLVISLAVAGKIYGEERAREEVVKQIRVAAGEPLAETVESVLQNTKKPEAEGFAVIVGLVTLFL